ncbi:lipid-A-disaccharide synthase [uncultured Brevundimonas sp.]|uniref:lipid-A-disaccharide synthase n=1 Tax=uncultured Brevundimonas sp. TaxID=213418 RepID=UPI0025CBF3E0|nr:lipid-A-disaccharide synthase [uncultured Brevundimonas sp.]
MLVAAEASGDALGAGLARALKARLGDGVAFVGIGGPRMAAEGVASPFDIAELAIVGVTEALSAYGRVRRRVRETADLAARERPDAVVLIDSWGFTSRVGKAIRKASPSTPLIKYVGPQVWASRPKRARALAKTADHLLALYSFDAPWFEREGLATTVVGSQALNLDLSAANGAAFRRRHAVDPAAPLLLILPGSRPGEIARMTPVYEQTAVRLKAELPELQIAVVASAMVDPEVRGRVAAWPFRAHLVEETEKYDAMKAADAALATSGTVTLEVAVAGAPMVIAYRIGAISYAIARRIVTAPFITLFNIAAGREVAPEFIQNAATPERLASALYRLLTDREAARRQSEAQTAALEAMGRGDHDPSELAADAVLKVIAERR